jgi:biotin carboxyl carrier protein
MKIRVAVEGRIFAVEIGDLHARPIVASVDGERFEVWPSADDETGQRLHAAGQTSPVAVTPAQSPAPASGPTAVRAPIPGVIVSVAVEPGTTVALGQELCALEAMKMKNIVRAARTGQIAKVNVAVGQHVRHRDVLMEYAE